MKFIKNWFIKPLLYLCKFAFIARFAMLQFLVFVLLAAFAGYQGPLMLRNVFLMETFARVFWVAFLSYLSMALCMSSMRVTLLNADARFVDIKEAGLAPGSTFSPGAILGWFAAWILLGSLVPAGCLFANGRQNDPEHYLAAMPGIAAVFLALLAAGIVLLLGAFISNLLDSTKSENDPHEELTPFDCAFKARLPHDMPSPSRWLFQGMPFKESPVFGGYFRIDNEKAVDYAPGHRQLLVALCLFLLVEIVLFKFADPEDPWFPTLAYLLLILTSTQLFLSALSFFFDYWRVPTLLVVVAYLVMTNLFWPIDHYFPVHSRNSAIAQTKGNDLEWENQAIERILTRHVDVNQPSAARTLVLVNAAGGGIQAAAWTARVLTGLHEEYPDSFGRATVVVSGVSGGSVGCLFYLAGAKSLREDDEKRREAALQLVNDEVRKSGLEATGWGLAFPDFWRTVLPPYFMLAPKDLDRGKALEDVWKTRIKRIREQLGEREDDEKWESLTIRQYSKMLQTPNRGPIAFFNTTAVGSGKRFVIGPFTLSSPNKNSVVEQFVTTFPEHDLNLLTAVRMSASFSYVSPMARPLEDGVPLPCRDWLADGGYADNEGIITNIDILISLLPHLLAKPKKDRPFDRVVVLRILPFPDSSRNKDDKQFAATEREKAREGWLLTYTGPIELLNRTRQASQIERGSLGLELVQALVAPSREGSNAQASDIARIADNARALKERHWQETKRESLEGARRDSRNANGSDVDSPLDAIEFGFVEFRFQLGGKENGETPEPPLSWKLSAREARDIDAAWKRLTTRDDCDNPFTTKRVSNGDPSKAKSLDEIFNPKDDAAATRTRFVPRRVDGRLDAIAKERRERVPGPTTDNR